MIRSLLLSASFLVLATAGAQADPASAEQLHQLIPGNSIEGAMNKGGGYQYYFAPDGSLHTGAKLGLWELRDNHLCLRFDPDPVQRPDCMQLEIEGDKVTWTSNGQTVGKGTLVAGNARGL